MKFNKKNNPDINSYVESFKRTHFLMIILTVLVALVSSELYDIKKLREQLKVLDVVFALQDLVQNDKFKKLPLLKKSDILEVADNTAASFIASDLQFRDIFKNRSDSKSKEGQEAIAKIEKRISNQDQQIVDRIKQLYSNNKILPNSYYVKNQYLFSNPGQSCKLGIYGGSNKRKNLITDTFLNATMGISRGNDIYLTNISWRCFGDYSENKSAILIKMDPCNNKNNNCKTEWLIGLPNKDMEKISFSSAFGDELINNINFSELNHLNSYKEYETYFIYHSDKYIYYPIEFYKKIVFDLASSKKNKIYRPDQLEEAITDLFNLGNKETDFLGIKFDEMTFLRLSPVLFVVLLYELYRRLLILAKFYKDIRVPWIFLEIDNIVDFIIAYTIALTPALCLIIISFLYVDIQGLFIDIFGYQVNPRNIITMNFPKTPGLGWLYADYWSWALFGVFFLIIFFVYKIQKNLFKILFNANKNWKTKIF